MRSSSALLLGLCLWVTSAQALDDDRNQPIRVKADSAERDDKQGITTYRGDVVIIQGSLNIRAQEVVQYGFNSVDKIVAKGNPARLQQQPEPDKGVITAKGNHIEYTMATEIVKLETNAYVEQDGTEVRGDQITYDMTRQVVRASGAINSSDRVEIIIPPNTTEISEPDDAAQGADAASASQGGNG